MKVIQHTSICLILQEKRLGVWCLGIGMAFFGLLVFISYEAPVDLLGSCCIAIASLLQVFNPTEICTLDKRADQLTLEQQNWFRRRVKRHAITQISEVRVEQRTLLGTPFYQIHLILDSGTALPLTQTVSTDWKQQRATAQSIRTFLKIK
jgi:hypothetical protein